MSSVFPCLSGKHTLFQVLLSLWLLWPRACLADGSGTLWPHKWTSLFRHFYLLLFCFDLGSYPAVLQGFWHCAQGGSGYHIRVQESNPAQPCARQMLYPLLTCHLFFSDWWRGFGSEVGTHRSGVFGAGKGLSPNTILLFTWSKPWCFCPGERLSQKTNQTQNCS